jgi:hypothetical protein
VSSKIPPDVLELVRELFDALLDFGGDHGWGSLSGEMIAKERSTSSLPHTRASLDHYLQDSKVTEGLFILR